MRIVLVSLILLSAVPAVAKITVVIRVTATAPNIEHWVWEEHVDEIDTPEGPGGGEKPSDPPPECAQMRPSISRLRLIPQGQNQTRQDGKFMWGDKYIAEVNRPTGEFDIIKLEVLFSFSPNEQKVADVHLNHNAASLPTRRGIVTQDLSRRAMYDSNVIEQSPTNTPNFPATGASFKAYPRMTARCSATGTRFEIEGDVVEVGETYFNQPYYELDNIEDCRFDRVARGVAFYQLTGNHQVAKPCGVQSTIEKTEQESWTEEYTNENKFSASMTAGLTAMNEVTAGLESLKGEVFSLKSSSIVKTTQIFGSDRMIFAGVEKRHRYVNVNVWTLADDRKDWDRNDFLSGQRINTYDSVWFIVNQCNGTLESKIPTDLGDGCTEYFDGILEDF